MLVIYPFSVVDQDLALKNARWIAELGEYKSHDIFILSDKRCDPDINRQVVETFHPIFHACKHRLTPVEIDGWPEGANYMFSYSTTLIQHTKEWPYFFWLEPDAIPISPGWLDALEAEYRRGKKPFMGDRVQVENIPLHMSGVGIYENPIYLHAGEAYRAHDTAWDMAAKDQIVPNAHFTNLIEHAWRHPTFADQSEVDSQIAKETILFHSSKDGSLIDRLMEKKFPVPVLAEPTPLATQAGQSEASGSTGASSNAPQYETPGGGEPIYDIFIRTYPGDYDWLYYCLKSIDKYVTGFRRIWVISSSNHPAWVVDRITRGPVPIVWKVMNEETTDGYLAQQIHKLYADVITDYQADYYLMLDSDTLFTRPTTPQDFFQDSKLIWYYTPYNTIKTPWQPVIEKFFNFPIEHEFMRRLPMMIPRWLFSKLREGCFHIHKRIISEYIIGQPLREFSEFNVLGAFAWTYHRNLFHFVDTTQTEMPGPLARQFFSWGGFTDEVKAEIQTILPNEEKLPPEKQDAPTPQASAPVASFKPTIKQEVEWHVEVLRGIADENPQHKARVVRALSMAGLKPNPRNKNKK